MLSMMCMILVVIIIAFIVIQRKNKKSDKAALKKSLEATGQKSTLSKTAFYQKVYLSLATTPIIKRYLFKVRMRLELVGNDDEYHVRAEAGKATLKAILLTILASVILKLVEDIIATKTLSYN